MLKVQQINENNEELFEITLNKAIKALEYTDILYIKYTECIKPAIDDMHAPTNGYTAFIHYIG